MRKSKITGKAIKQGSMSFTLIELLVIIAIIAILAAMLLPALNSARLKGKDINCISNLKGLGKQMIFYHNDNKRIMPVIIQLDGKWLSWKDVLYCYMNPAEFPVMTPDAHKRKSDSYPKGIFACPSQPSNAAYCHYGLNQYQAGSGGDWTKTLGLEACLDISGIARPSERLLTGDNDSGILNGQSAVNPWSEPDGGIFEYRVARRHSSNKGMNILYVDGHVSYQSYNYVMQNLWSSYLWGKGKR